VRGAQGVLGRREAGSVLVGALLLAALLVGGMGGDALSARPECPRGTTAVEDVATGAVRCEREDSLDTREAGPAPLPPAEPPPAPAAPESPGAPAAPGAPQAPRRIPGAQADCGLARWGCEEACGRKHLAESQAPGSAAAQRAAVAYGACLRVCGQEFQCEPRLPETPIR